jgi:hypothetical protein
MWEQRFDAGQRQTSLAQLTRLAGGTGGRAGKMRNGDEGPMEAAQRMIVISVAALSPTRGSLRPERPASAACPVADAGYCGRCRATGVRLVSDR